MEIVAHDHVVPGAGPEDFGEVLASLGDEPSGDAVFSADSADAFEVFVCLMGAFLVVVTFFDADDAWFLCPEECLDDFAVFFDEVVDFHFVVRVAEDEGAG